MKCLPKLVVDLVKTFDVIIDHRVSRGRLLVCNVEEDVIVLRKVIVLKEETVELCQSKLCCPCRRSKCRSRRRVKSSDAVHAKNEDLEDAHNNEAFILDIDQCFQRFLDGADQDPSSIWSIARSRTMKPIGNGKRSSATSMWPGTTDNLTPKLGVPENALTKIGFIEHNKHNQPEGCNNTDATQIRSQTTPAPRSSKSARGAVDFFLIRV